MYTYVIICIYVLHISRMCPYIRIYGYVCMSTYMFAYVYIHKKTDIFIYMQLSVYMYYI
jgi:hypothetical protein